MIRTYRKPLAIVSALLFCFTTGFQSPRQNSTQAADDNAEALALLAFPSAFELGEREVDSKTELSLWVANDGDGEIRVLEAKGSCGCVKLTDFRATTLKPGFASELRLSIHAPKIAGESKSTQLTLILDNDRRLVVPIKLQSVEKRANAMESQERATLAAAPPNSEHAIQSMLPRLDVGSLRPAQSAETALWLVNKSNRAALIEDVVPSCGCMRLHNFEATSLAPGQFLAVPLRVQGSTRSSGQAVKHIKVLTAGERPFDVPVHLNTIETDA